ncbi:DapH/DapD/GlmU-related protein [Sphingomonas trueperi]|uniref:acyltransferase n=1 Tax=Sphingomonas trueperi TaxID=53317 RepID=UPI000EB0A330|nr:DapH/DapD/GlmU-related protein [uncultured Sphingomonas sp.]
MASLNKLIWLQRLIVRLRIRFYNKFWGMDIHPTVRISNTAKLDKTFPKGIHIDEWSYVAFGAAILSHDMTRNLKTDTYIGKSCFIGARSLILPGVRVGDGSIVAAGSVVTKDVPPKSIVAGNPAVVVRSGIETDIWGILRKPGEPYLRDALVK